MLRAVIIVLVALAATACGQGSTAKIPSDVTYTVKSDHALRTTKRQLKVILNKKVSKNTLKAIARKLKRSDPQNYQRTFITYRIKGESGENGAWATTHFNPELKVSILGLTNDQEASFKKSSDVGRSEEIIGSWLDDRAHVGNRVTVYTKDGSLYIHRIFSDGSNNTEPLIEKDSSRGRKLAEKDRPDSKEYYLITTDGELEYWDNLGKFYTAKPIK